MSVLARVVSTFVAPAEGPAPAGPAVAPAAAGQSVAVVAAGEQLALAARIVVAASMHTPGAGTALLCWWGAAQPLPPRLGGAATAQLPDDPRLAREAVTSACSVAPPGPLIVAIGGPRPAEFDELIAGADALIIAWSRECEQQIAELAYARGVQPEQAGGVLRLPTGLQARAALSGIPGAAATRDARALLQRVPRCGGVHNAHEMLHALA